MKDNPAEFILNFLKVKTEDFEESRKDMFNDKVGDVVVDTCCTPDTGIWETGIKQNGKCIIVEDYPEGREFAQEGHNKWIQKMTENPQQKLHDVHLVAWGIEE